MVYPTYIRYCIQLSLLNYLLAQNLLSQEEYQLILDLLRKDYHLNSNLHI